MVFQIESVNDQDDISKLIFYKPFEKTHNLIFRLSQEFFLLAVR
jgi:hypothetical protein